MEKIEVREYEVFKYVWECPKCYTEHKTTNVFKKNALVCNKCKTLIHREDTELSFWKIFKNL